MEGQVQGRLIRKMAGQMGQPAPERRLVAGSFLRWGRGAEGHRQAQAGPKSHDARDPDPAGTSLARAISHSLQLLISVSKMQHSAWIYCVN